VARNCLRLGRESNRGNNQKDEEVSLKQKKERGTLHGMLLQLLD
jgi:hypothetical protein